VTAKARSRPRARRDDAVRQILHWHPFRQRIGDFGRRYLGDRRIRDTHDTVKDAATLFVAKFGAREDSNLKPERYERSARLDARPLNWGCAQEPWPYTMIE
jgi:hypothetical protein